MSANEMPRPGPDLDGRAVADPSGSPDGRQSLRNILHPKGEGWDRRRGPASGSTSDTASGADAPQVEALKRCRRDLVASVLTAMVPAVAAGAVWHWVLQPVLISAGGLLLLTLCIFGKHIRKARP